MIYKVISVLCHPADQGVSIGYAEFQNISGRWEYSNFITSKSPYPGNLSQQLQDLHSASLFQFSKLNNEIGAWLANEIKKFIQAHHLEFRVQLISLKGFSVIKNETCIAEAGNPALIAAETGINVIADYYKLNTALNGNGNLFHAVPSGLLPDADHEVQLALMAILRWREENNFMAEQTGAARNCSGGSVLLGQEA